MKIFIIGYMATGKTRFGKRLANEIDYSFVDLDVLFQNIHGWSPAEFIRRKGEEVFRIEESRVLKEKLPETEKLIVSCGGGTPCFHNNMEWMKNNGKTIWLNIPKERIFQRLTEQKGDRPMIPITNGTPDYEKFLTHYSEREKFYAMADFSFDEANLDAVLTVLHL
ncbi:MAG: shikimate kinase [Bacteroidales bacterium]|nr:shikimate kinase [Bacteroidales bacterium]